MTKSSVITALCGLYLCLASGAQAQQDATSAPILFMKDGYDFVILDKKQIHPETPDVFSGQWPVVLEQDVPQINAPLTPQALSFNRAARDFVTKKWAAYGGPASNDPNEDGQADYLLFGGYLAGRNENVPNFRDAPPGLISIPFVFEVNGHGGAGSSYVFIFNWLIFKQCLLQPDDIFDTSKNWKQALIKLVYAQRPWAQSYPPVDISKEIVDPDHWLIYNRGIEFGFSQGEFVGIGNGGATVAILIPWTSLAPYLNKSGLIKP